ncbi:MAG TPA: 3'-5' exonuclease [Ktedonosporobacter sp.]|nr:3'-5' exonuclease [Ktedonosporobacter sp.]
MRKTVDALDALSLDQATFLVLDFETTTPPARPPEPIELAALRIGPGLRIDHTVEVSWLIRPPEDAPLTTFDTRQTGIRADDVREALSVQDILLQLEKLIDQRPALLVAHHARYDYAILQRFASACPFVASLPCIDTIPLAKRVLPALSNYKLDTLAQHFALPIPVARHRAFPDVQLTVAVFWRLVQAPNAPTTIADLRTLAGVGPKSAVPEPAQQLRLW